MARIINELSIDAETGLVFSPDPTIVQAPLPPISRECSRNIFTS